MNSIFNNDNINLALKMTAKTILVGAAVYGIGSLGYVSYTIIAASSSMVAGVFNTVVYGSALAKNGSLMIFGIYDFFKKLDAQEGEKVNNYLLEKNTNLDMFATVFVYSTLLPIFVTGLSMLSYGNMLVQETFKSYLHNALLGTANLANIVNNVSLFNGLRNVLNVAVGSEAPEDKISSNKQTVHAIG